ncbi:Abi family protein [Curtobacterium sp. 22159]|uniref:Abi family protein n=1 Tax=Curtobacterium sp. 22159 TaxID=3453882 RepID=UPI003F87E464
MSRHRAEQFRQALRERGLDASGPSVHRVHAFDSAVRSSLLALTEQIELALRGRLERAGNERFGPRWYLAPSAFRAGFDHAGFLDRAGAALSRAQDPAARATWAERRFERVPFGMLTEELSLGELARLTSGVEPRLHDAVASSFRVPPSTFRPCLQHLTHVRNCCAHHTRLWGRRMRVPPPTFRSPPDLVERLAGLPKRSPAHSLELLAHLAETVGPCDRHAAAFRQLLDDHDDLVVGLGGRPAWAAA